MITAIIPVRKGSQRCVNKNNRLFNNSTLLRMKINTLKQSNLINEIIVSSDCEIMLHIANEMGVKTHKRDKYYASSECSNSEYWEYLAKTMGSYDTILMANCVAPMVDTVDYNDIIEKYNTIQNTNSGLITVNNKHKYYIDLETSTPINYTPNNTVNSQLLKPIAELTFGVCIAERSDILQSKCIYGSNPYYYNVDTVKSMDIDDNVEYVTSELLYKHNITTSVTANEILKRRKDTPLLLDCTIRDGGYLNKWAFTTTQVIECYQATTDAMYDYFEIGFRSSLGGSYGTWYYSTEENINSVVKEVRNGCKIAVMARIGSASITDFIPKSKSSITMVRVLLPDRTKETIQSGVSLCSQLIQLGYTIALNVACCDTIPEEDIQFLCECFNTLDISFMYLADTYGSYNEDNLPHQIHLFYKYTNIPLGFHAHNNNGMALHKTKLAIFHGCVIIDTCIGGYGRGAGNLKAEQFLCDLYSRGLYDIKNSYNSIKYYLKWHKTTDYPPYYNLSGVFGIHPDLIQDLIEYNIETSVSLEIIHRMKNKEITKENIKELLQWAKHKNKHADKKCYVLGTGPSSDTFIIPDNDTSSVYLGMNKYATYNCAPRLNFLFLEYFNKSDSKIMNDLNIFYEARTTATNEINSIDYPNSVVYNVETMGKEIGFTFNPAKWANTSSTAFIVALFGAYLGCKEIYLIGCDCNITPYNTLKPGWVEIKRYIHSHYPNVKIIHKI